MYLHSVEAVNFRGFKRLKSEFKEKFTILCGPNASGKSSILYAIAHAYSHYDSDESTLDSETAIKVEITNKENEREFIGRNRGSFESNGYRNSNLRNFSDDFFPGTSTLVRASSNNYKKINFFFIGPQRTIDYRSIQGMVKEPIVEDSQQKYCISSVKSLKCSVTPNIKQWIINRYFIIEKDWAEIERKNWTVLIEYLDRISDGNKIFKYLRTGKDLEPLFNLDEKEVHLEQLSSGYKSICSIIFSIVEWIESTNKDSDALIENATGVVFIDELELHLHPSWQIKIKNVLTDLFKSMQFVVTTHSPHIINDANKNELGILDNPDNSIIVNFLDKGLANWKVDYIFSDIMGFESNSENAIYETIQKVEDFISNKQYSLAIEEVDAYEKFSHVNDHLPRYLKNKIYRLMEVEGVDNND
ncbi:AAA family ATPase [Photobacterium ganghwense]|uniref:AAA family ATPase n=1 Tax=Photobacterium ganghwense TaxID=320778 RepID=UPI0039F08338